MPRLIAAPSRIVAEGNLLKTIDEFIGVVSSKTPQVSIARMASPPG